MNQPQHSTDAAWSDPEPTPAQHNPLGGGVIRLYGEQFERDPAGLYREIRENYGPVAPILLEGDLPAWFVSGYREVHQVTGDSRLFARDCRRWNAWHMVPDDWPLMPFVGYQPSVMFTEGSEHRRRAGAISQALSAVDQHELRAHCEQIADQLIDRFAGSGEADLMADYALRIPLLVVAKLFGMPDTEAPDLARDVAISLDSGEDAVPAYLRVRESMQRLLQHKRRQPGPDVPSRLLYDPADLDEEELVQDLIVVTAAAQQPTANWIGNTLRLMLTDTQFAVTLSGGRRSVGQALNEVLWEDTPTQNFLGRWATQDTRLGGQRIRKGDLLVLGLSAANHDPAVHAPAASGATSNHAHMSFGHGEHGCPEPAPELAEIIARTAVEVLLDRLPDVVLAVPAEKLQWHPSVWMRGLAGLPVEFSPAYVSADRY